MENRKLPMGTGEPESRLAVPLDVQLEIAEQNKQLAEFRYRTLVRRGRAWQVGTNEEARHIK